MRPPILMIHGMWGGGWCWDGYRRYFEDQGFACEAPTLPWHDVDPRERPPAPLGDLGLLDYVAFLEERAARLPGRPILMGHSMGGLLALQLAARIEAAAVVALTPAPLAGVFVHYPSVVLTFLSTQLRWRFWSSPMRPTFCEARYGMYHLLPKRLQRSTYGRLVHESGRAASEIGYWFCYRDRPSAVALSDIECRVLVIGARQDRITPARCVRAAAGRIARVLGERCTYEELHDHAHWVLAEPGWEAVAGRVHDWLRDVLPGVREALPADGAPG